MRRLKLFFIFLFILTPILLPATPFDEDLIVDVSEVEGLGAAKLVGTVSTHGYGLNVRTAPWGTIVGSLSDNQKIEIISSSGDWYKIKYKGATRYIHKNYVSLPGKKASMKEPAKEKAGYVNTPGTCLNVRTGAWGRIVGTLSHGSKVKIIGESGDWYKISYKGATRYIYKKYVNSTKTTSSSTAASKPTSSANTYKASVIGKSAGDGSAAGAITWARDQINGTKKGYNPNNGKTSRDPKAWAGWCLAFVNSAYGRKKPLLSAYSAIKSYYKCKAAGKIHTNKNPPAGAAMFTGTTPGNPYGHIFIATGKMNGPNDPIIITTTSYGVKEMPMSQMWKGPAYLGWAMP